MFRGITDGARQLDEWLENNLGRPYHMVLTVGLVLEMVQKLQTLPKSFTHTGGLIGLMFALAVQSALLINQLGEFSHRREKLRRSRSLVGSKGEPAADGESPVVAVLGHLGRRIGRRLRGGD